MNKKTFLILSLIIILVVSIITSLIAVYYFQKQVLLSGQLGTIGVTGLETGTVNVIIIDPTIISQISDVVQFSAAWGASRQTSVSSTSLPRPFVIRNDGTVNANIDVYTTTRLFSSPNSKLWVWAEQPTSTNVYMDSTGTIPVTLDGCSAAGGCYASASCAPGTCEMPVGAANRLRIISSFYADDNRDTAFIHLRIDVANDELAGAKSTTMTIVGTAV